MVLISLEVAVKFNFLDDRFVLISQEQCFQIVHLPVLNHTVAVDKGAKEQFEKDLLAHEVTLGCPVVVVDHHFCFVEIISHL